MLLYRGGLPDTLVEEMKCRVRGSDQSSSAWLLVDAVSLFKCAAIEAIVRNANGLGAHGNGSSGACAALHASLAMSKLCLKASMSYTSEAWLWLGKITKVQPARAPA